MDNNVMAATRIRAATPADAGRLAEIYNHYILNSIITFEEEEVSTGEMVARVAEVGQAGLPWLVADSSAGVVGYAYASKWKGRCAYRYSVESTVYLDPGAIRQGLGTQLYTSLFARLQEQKIHVIIGGIALPNPASIALHERFGMRKVAQFEEVGFKFGQWIDVGYWQISLKPGP